MQAQYRFIRNEDNNSFGVVVLPSANLPYMITVNSEEKTKHHKYYEIDCESCEQFGGNGKICDRKCHAENKSECKLGIHIESADIPIAYKSILALNCQDAFNN